MIEHLAHVWSQGFLLPKGFNMKQRKYIQPNYAEYERQKREWERLNPNATPEQYQQAMTAIARKLGV